MPWLWMWRSASTMTPSAASSRSSRATNPSQRVRELCIHRQYAARAIPLNNIHISFDVQRAVRCNGSTLAH